MPVLRTIRERFAAEKPLDGVRAALCLHITPETGCLALALRAAGADVDLCAANPFATQDDIVAALDQVPGVNVKAARGEDADAYAGHLEELVGRGPQVIVDDGGGLIAAAHADDAAERMIGATEETTIGLARLRAMGDALRFPVLAVNEAVTERVFNDRYGTGQSALDGILRATNLLLAGRTLVVLGYGYTGKGIAARARGAGAIVIVCEVDAIAALEARMDGFEVLPVLDAASRGDVFVTVTGVPGALRREHFERMKDGAVLANAGHFDVEIALDELRDAAGSEPRAVLPMVDEYRLDGRRLHVLAKGRVVNLAAAAGHPAAMMDISFAAQALAVAHLVAHGAELGPGVHAVPPELDEVVAATALESLGVQIDALSEEQRRYQRAFR